MKFFGVKMYSIMIPDKKREQENELAIKEDVEVPHLNQQPLVAARHLAVEIIPDTVTVITTNSLGETIMVTKPGRKKLPEKWEEMKNMVKEKLNRK